MTNVEAQTGIGMPEYLCHKKVHALQIKSVDKSKATIEFKHIGYGALVVGEQFITKHNPKADGYYVVYYDGYISFSPQSAFEKGYTKIVGTGLDEAQCKEKAAKGLVGMMDKPAED